MATLEEMEKDCGVSDQEPDVTVELPKQILMSDDLPMLFLGNEGNTHWYGYIDAEKQGCYRATDPSE